MIRLSASTRFGALLGIGLMFASAVPGVAQTVPVSQILTPGFSSAMAETLKSHKKHVDATGAAVKPADDSVPPPITDSDATKPQFLPPNIDYQAKAGFNFAEGPTDSIRHALEGTVDAGVIVKLNPRTRVAAAYYQVVYNGLGFDQGTIPIGVQGHPGTVITQENLTSFQPDPSSKVEIYVFALERLFTIDNSPLVASFAYDSQHAFTFGKVIPVLAFHDNTAKAVYLETGQHYNLLISEPFVLDDQKLFLLFNEQIQQLTHSSGLNVAPNRPQLLYSALFQYDINDKTSFFIEPAKNVVYFPPLAYPQNQAVFYYGLTYKLRKPFFFQATIYDVTPTNPDYDGTHRIGITHVTIPCPPNPTGTGLSAQCRKNLLNQTTAPTFGGTKFATINLSIGIGTPPVVTPF